MPMSPRRAGSCAAAIASVGLFAMSLLAQTGDWTAETPSATSSGGPPTSSPEADRVAAAKAAGLSDSAAAWIGEGVTRLLAMQEGEGRDQWPYEGVYRVRGRIPVGYRVGGTSIAATALLQAPGLAEDSERCEAILRAAEFVAGAIDDAAMSPDYRGGYDVRGWGYAYALRFLVRLEASLGARLGASGPLGDSPAPTEAVSRAIDFYIDGLEAIEIPEVGGWNYARRGPLDRPSPAAPFMTAPCVRSLLEAKQAGRDVDDGVVQRALASLATCRGADGTYAYSGDGRGRIDPSSRPGAIGRMVAADAVLHAAGRLDAEDLRRSLESFFAYWEELEVRRAQTGTHVAPYGVAPYYFMYAHGAAGEAIECLPPPWRMAFRRALWERLAQVRGEDGTWNDRIFPRSANYGTALALEAMLAPIAPPMPRWNPPAPVENGNRDRSNGLKHSGTATDDAPETDDP